MSEGKSEYVVLHNGLSRRMEAISDEEFRAMKGAAPGMVIPRYRIAPAYERGDVVSEEEITGPYFGQHDNLKRLLNIGAIGPLDHPEAAAAIAERKTRQRQDALALEGQAVHA